MCRREAELGEPVTHSHHHLRGTTFLRPCLSLNKRIQEARNPRKITFVSTRESLLELCSQLFRSHDVAMVT
jgi:hypothetical protein